MESYELKIKVLGLRNLKSLGLLPVKRPFIKFDINGLKPKEQKQALAEKKFIQTQPKETGTDPNISTIIKYNFLHKYNSLFISCKIDLPKNYLYCPSLNVSRSKIKNYFFISVLCSIAFIKALFNLLWEFSPSIFLTLSKLGEIKITKNLKPLQMLRVNN